jgi:hypothetical protein
MVLLKGTSILRLHNKNIQYYCSYLYHINHFLLLFNSKNLQQNSLPNGLSLILAITIIYFVSKYFGNKPKCQASEVFGAMDKVFCSFF